MSERYYKARQKYLRLSQKVRLAKATDRVFPKGVDQDSLQRLLALTLDNPTKGDAAVTYELLILTAKENGWDTPEGLHQLPPEEYE